MQKKYDSIMNMFWFKLFSEEENHSDATKCPICSRPLPANSVQSNGVQLKDPLPCTDCYNRFKRRRSSQPRIRRNSDLGTISENVSQDCKFGTDLDLSREVSCNFCPNPIILPSANLIHHLKHRHSAFGYDNDQIFYEFRNGCDSEHFGQNGTYTPDYICQGSQYFFSQGCNQNGVFHGWVSMLAPKHVAKEYLATIVIHCPNPKSQLPLHGLFKFKKTQDLQWTIPVQPFGEEQPPLSLCYSIRWSQLKPYLQKNVPLRNGMKVKYSWSTRISIFRA